MKRVEDECIDGEQLRIALQILGLWFDGNVLSVRISPRDSQACDPLMTGHASAWVAEANVGMPFRDGEPYQFKTVRVPVHPGRACDAVRVEGDGAREPGCGAREERNAPADTSLRQRDVID